VEAQRRFGDVSVLALAHHVGVSERTLHRGFLDWVGGAPKPFLRALRVREAASRTQGPRALVEIAAELGFSDQAHLSREMRELWGTTPARLRSGLSDFFKTRPAAAP
jgi:transcriptional regulator GlxA family with amidase domain